MQGRGDVFISPGHEWDMGHSQRREQKHDQENNQEECTGLHAKQINPIGIQYFGFEMRRFIFYRGYLLSSLEWRIEYGSKKLGFIEFIVHGELDLHGPVRGPE